MTLVSDKYASTQNDINQDKTSIVEEAVSDVIGYCVLMLPVSAGFSSRQHLDSCTSLLLYIIVNEQSNNSSAVHSWPGVHVINTLYCSSSNNRCMSL